MFAVQTKVEACAVSDMEMGDLMRDFEVDSVRSGD